MMVFTWFGIGFSLALFYPLSMSYMLVLYTLTVFEWCIPTRYRQQRYFYFFCTKLGGSIPFVGQTWWCCEPPFSNRLDNCIIFIPLCRTKDCIVSLTFLLSLSLLKSGTCPTLDYIQYCIETCAYYSVLYCCEDWTYMLSSYIILYLDKCSDFSHC